MSRLLVDDITKTDRRALFNVNKAALISDIVAPSKEYLICSGAQQLTVIEGCVIAIAGTGVFETEQTILTAANLDTGSSFAVGKDYYVYVCDSGNVDNDEVYKISLNSTYPSGWTALNSRKIGGFHYGKVRGVAAGRIIFMTELYRVLCGLWDTALSARQRVWYILAAALG